jgi:RHS repeat-associated protein
MTNWLAGSAVGLRDGDFGWSTHFKALILCSAAAFLCSVAGVSQSNPTNAPLLNSVNDHTQMPIPGSGHDYQHFLGETVNYSNGSVSFKVSFPTATGRGLSLPYAWSYNSAAVNQVLAVDGNTPTWNSNGGNPWPQEDGWTFEGTPHASVQVFSLSPPTAPPNVTIMPCYYQSGMTFTDASGVTHNLHTAAYAPESSYTGSGYISTCGPQPFVQPPGGDGQVVATIQPNAAANNLMSGSTSANTGPFIVEDKEGTIYSFSGYSVQLPNGGSANSWIYPNFIEDRNGNKISISANGAYTDSMGRSGPTGSNTSLVLDGLTYGFSWGSENVNYQVTAQGGGASPTLCQTFPTTVTGTHQILNSITLPNMSLSYQFFYGSYGLLDEIIFPDGGWVKYTYALSPEPYEQASLGGEQLVSTAGNQNYYQPISYGCNWIYQAPVLATRTVSFDGVHVAQTQTFTFHTNWNYSNGFPNGWSSKTAQVLTTDNVTGLTSEVDYIYSPMGVPGQWYQTNGIATTVPVESTITYYDWGKSGSSMAKQVTKTWLDQFNLASETTTIYPHGVTPQVSKTTYTYTSGLCNNPSLSSLVYLTEKDDYDFGNGAPGPLTKKTLSNYACFSAPGAATYSSYNPSQFVPPQTAWSNYVGAVIPPQLSSVTIEDGGSNPQAESLFYYDGSALASVPASLIQYDASYNAVTIRSNLTSVVRCNPVPSCSTSTSPTTTYTYDLSGQPSSMTDPKLNQTQFSFADSFTDSGPSNPTNGYLTKITRANGLYSTYKYSYALGYLTASTDLNPGNTTTYKYGTSVSGCSATDFFNRPTEVDFPDGGLTTNCYDDSHRTVTTSQLIDTGVTKTTVTTRDGMFHTVETQLTSDPEGTDEVDIVPDGEGHVYTKTNPYRPGHPSTTDGTNTYRYDAFGRTIEVSEPDGSLIQTCYDANASNPTVSYCSSGPLGNVKSGAIVDSTDEAGNHWQRMSDAFGRLTEVMEPNGTAQTPSMETDYTYNTLDDLKQVDQWGGAYNAPGERQRKFVYDPLSRLTSAQNPENGTVTYAYTTSGSLCAGDVTLPCSKTDARGATINYAYDSLNRLGGKTYSGSGFAATAAVSYTYDQGSSGFPKGHRSSMTDGPGSESWTYDSMGRILSINRSTTTPVSPQSNSATYTYTKGGLPSLSHFFAQGTYAVYTYAGAGRATSVNWNSTPYAYGALYTPTGQLDFVNLGGGSASSTELTVENSYNNRLQPTSMWAAPTSNLSSKIYNHSLTYPTAAQGNNGNILQDLDNVASPVTTVTYTYDTLNRLKTAQTGSTAAPVPWGDSYVYDQFGSLYQKNVIGSGQGETLQATPNSQNQLTGIGMTYDASGDVTKDNLGTQYTWDAEGRMVTAGIWSYSYDGDGNRVLKSQGSTSSGSVYWYGPDGAMTDETTVAMNGNNAMDLQRNVYLAGKLVARQGFTNTYYPSYFLIPDQVGSSRVSVDFRWNYQSAPTQYPPNTTYYYPFGTYVVTPTSDSTLDQRFTGKIRDTETGNDYFGARYYTGSVSRFMSPDWSAKVEPVPYSKLDDPQTLNLYAYVGNNPLSRVDADGHGCSKSSSASSVCNAEGENASEKADDLEDYIFGGGTGLRPGDPAPAEKTTGFATRDDAGIAAVSAINPKSISEGIEYSGALFQSSDGTWGFTPPVRKDTPDADRASPAVGPDDVPKGTTYGGDYHTHGNGKIPHSDPEHFSPSDRLVNFDNSSPGHVHPGYLGTPSRAIKRYTPDPMQSTNEGRVDVWNSKSKAWEPEQ